MKNDTTQTVRVTVTFNQDNDPEWVETLNRMTNGRAKAELLRRHLNPPPPFRGKAVAKVAETLALPIESIAPPVAKVKPVSKAIQVATTEQEVAQPLVTEASSSASEKKPRQRTRGALAGGMLASGEKTWP